AVARRLQSSSTRQRQGPPVKQRFADAASSNYLPRLAADFLFATSLVKSSSLMYVTLIQAWPISSTVRSPKPTHWSGSGLFLFPRVLSYHAVTRRTVPFGKSGAASSA